MKTPRLPALAAAMTAATVLAACGGGTNAGSGVKSTTLTLASVDQGSIEDVVKAFEAANPGVKVNFTTSGPTSTSSRFVLNWPPAPHQT